ncbi:MAG TPA: hypothetical protein VFE86_19245 [Ilumatobacteraceae bacterium]|nr:hypothetical protein [Ilumatobacteraceae bacterium]
MNDVDNGEFARELFGRLAATMPDNPDRPAAVQRIVRRRHRRRAATRATVGLTFAAGVGLVLVDARRPQPLPAAAAATPTIDTAATKPADPCADLGTSTKGPHTGSDAHPRGDVGKLKVAGTITAVDGDTISLSVEESSVDTSDITATISTDAKYIDAGAVSLTRPTLAVGDLVAVGVATQADGSYTIDALEAHDPGVPGDKPGTATEEAKPLASPDDPQIDAAKQAHAIELCSATTG